MKKDNSNNYDLKSEAVEELVDAQSGEIPEYSEEELGKYRSKSKFHIPELVKITFLKAWFAGAVCYFILWGLGMYVNSLVDMLFVLGIALGMVTDLLLNNVLRFIEKTPGANEKWILVSVKGTAGFFLNILYAFLILLGVFMLYNLINSVAMMFTGDPENLLLGVEPVLFGVFCMAFDMLFLGMRRMIAGIIDDAKKAARSGRG